MISFSSVKHYQIVIPACLVFSSSAITLHGIEVDTVNQTLALPPDKVASLRQKLINLAKRKKTTLKEMQSLIGSLNFACRAIAPGRAFLRRLIDLTRGKTRANHRIRITGLNSYTPLMVSCLSYQPHGCHQMCCVSQQMQVVLHMGLSWGLHGCWVTFPLHGIPSIFPSKNSYRSYWLSGAGDQYGLINVSCFFRTTQQLWQ